MPSVTTRIGQIKQPKGGYLGAVKFEKTELNDSRVLHETENISASLIGISVDYLTRTIMEKRKAIGLNFVTSILGATALGQEQYAYKLLDEVTGLSDKSIIAVCKLASFDICFRAGVNVYKTIENVTPDKPTIDNIAIMVDRACRFFALDGPLVSTGFTFEGGYTSTISSGDGDYLTERTLWDMKNIRSEITNKHTLQILVYYIMGMHLICPEFYDIQTLGMFNPGVI